MRVEERSCVGVGVGGAEIIAEKECSNEKWMDGLCT